MLTIVKDVDLINDIEKYDIILVGTNTYQIMGNGFQKKVRMKYPETYKLNLTTKYGDKSKVGTRVTTSTDNKPRFSLCFVTNGCNFRPDLSPDYLDYQGLEKCLKTANNEFQNLNVATTVIGCSKWDGNGDRDKVLKLISNNCNKINLFVYDYEQLERNIENAIRYNKIVDSKDLTSEQKHELLLKNIEQDKKLASFDNPIKRTERIKNDTRDLLKK
jgi:hypothetical protein